MDFDNRATRALLAAVFLTGAAIGYKFGYDAPISVAYEEWEVIRYQHELPERLISLDCGTSAYLLETGAVWRSPFSCRDLNYERTDHINLTGRRLVNSGTVDVCRRYLRGQGYCDNSGEPLEDK